MTAQLERPPKKIRIQIRIQSEKSARNSRDLARRINFTCGGALDDKVLLKDLFFWNVKDSPNSHPSDKWVSLVQDFTHSEKVLFFHALGMVTRRIEEACENPSLGNLRSLTREELLKLRGLNIVTTDLLIGAFRKNNQNS